MRSSTVVSYSIWASAPASQATSRAELAGQILQAAGGHVDRCPGRGLAGVGATLVRSGDVTGAQAALGSREQIVGVCRHHHAIAWRQIECLASGQIDTRLGLVVAGGLGAQDRIPRQVVAAREIDHQRDVAVRDWRQHAATLEPRQAARHVRPGVEPMPGGIAMARDGLRQTRDAEARHDALEIVPVQHVELAERDAPAAHLLHRWLVLVAPGIGEAEPIESIAERLENRLGLARDAGAPVDQRAEHVEEQSLRADRHGYEPAGSIPLDLSTSAAAGPDSALTRAFAASASLPLVLIPEAYTV